MKKYKNLNKLVERTNSGNVFFCSHFSNLLKVAELFMTILVRLETLREDSWKLPMTDNKL